MSILFIHTFMSEDKIDYEGLVVVRDSQPQDQPSYLFTIRYIYISG